MAAKAITLDPRKKGLAHDPLGTLRGAIRASPWLTIAFALHAIFGAILGIVYLASERASEEPALIGVSIADHRVDAWTPQPEAPPEIYRRYAIPEPSEAGEVVPRDTPLITLPDFEPDPNQDLHLPIGDPNPNPGLPGTTCGTSIEIGSPSIQDSTTAPTMRRSRLTTRMASQGGIAPT